MPRLKIDIPVDDPDITQTYLRLYDDAEIFLTQIESGEDSKRSTILLTRECLPALIEALEIIKAAINDAVHGRSRLFDN